MASIEPINGAQSDNVFWQAGSSATIGADSVIFEGILADASLTGRAVRLNGVVTMDDNLVSIASDPEPNTFWADAPCLVTLGAGGGLSLWRRQRCLQK